MLNCFCYPFPMFHTPLHCAQGCDLPFLLVPSLSSLSVEPSQFSLVVYCAWFGCHAAVELDTFSTGKHSKIVPRSDYPKQDSLEQIRRDLAWHARGEPWARPAPAGCCSARDPGWYVLVQVSQCTGNISSITGGQRHRDSKGETSARGQETTHVTGHLIPKIHSGGQPLRSRRPLRRQLTTPH